MAGSICSAPTSSATSSSTAEAPSSSSKSTRREGLEQRPAAIRDLVNRFHTAVIRLRRLEVPVLGVAHGNAAGGGVSLLAACDVVAAAESTRFRLGWTGIGITMDGGATWLLPRIVGLHRAPELIYTNRIFTAEEAHAWGFVNWLVPDGAPEQKAAELAAMLAGGPTSVLGACKRLVTDGMTQTFETQLEDKAVAIVRSFAGHDSDEGFRALGTGAPGSPVSDPQLPLKETGALAMIVRPAILGMRL